LWLDASDASTLYNGASLAAADEPISSWRDKSGNARHATQSTGVSQPLRKSAVQNGKDVVRFDGVNDYMDGSELFSGSSPCTMIAVYTPIATTGVHSIIGQSSNLTPNTWRVLQFRTVAAIGDPYFAGYANDLTDVTTPTTNTKIATFTYTGTVGSLFRNGNQIVTRGMVLSTTSANYAIGRDADPQRANCDIAEILVFPTALSAAERENVELYLNRKWAIY